MKKTFSRSLKKGLVMSPAYYFGSMTSWATVDPFTFSGSNPGKIQNLTQGNWVDAAQTYDCIDPLNGEVMLKVPDTQVGETDTFIDALKAVPKSGVHNPIKNPDRYLLYGKICRELARYMRDPEVEDFFTKLIQRVAPKSDGQARGEHRVTTSFIENWSGDQPRFLAQGFTVSGDHAGQESQGMRWPYGPVGLIAPFNFPLEIPTLQLLGSLMLGNKPVMKVDSKVSVVMEQFLRLAHHVGMPLEDVEFINCDGPVMEHVIKNSPLRTIQFTGSSKIAEHLCNLTNGKVKIEDAGFDWKILGPDVRDVDHVAWIADQDAYAFGGQKCSAQSIVFAHENWVKEGIFDKMGELAARRSLEELTVVPVLTWNNTQIKAHIDAILEIPGAKVLFGGKPLTNHTIPDVYGAYEPTAVFVPFDELLKEENFGKCTTELFGPFQIVTEYKEGEIDAVLGALERMEHHLTAAVVSNDIQFMNHVLGNTVNGTTYAGIRARTTGAPQNHWFGPGGDPRGAGIGSPEALKLVWSCHREIIRDVGPVAKDWTTPKAT